MFPTAARALTIPAVVPLISLFSIVLISYVIVRTGAVALVLTGLSRDAADFQAQSAFMGVGFTTAEAESVVGHPARRRIIRLLMLLGYVGLGTGLATIVTTFAATSGGELASRAAWTTLTTPSPDTLIESGDTLLCYGREIDLERLNQRPCGEKGDRMHELEVGRVEGLQHLEKTEDQVAATSVQAPQDV